MFAHWSLKTLYRNFLPVHTGFFCPTLLALSEPSRRTPWCRGFCNMLRQNIQVQARDNQSVSSKPLLQCRQRKTQLRL